MGKTAVAYTDGSYDKRTGNYGYGVLFYHPDGKKKEMCGGAKDKTGGWQVNGELEAVKKAVDYAIKNGYKKLEIRYDYEGVRCWADQVWKRNKDYTKAYAAFISQKRKKIDIRFVHVKGHSGDYGNEQADSLAKMGVEFANARK